MKYFLMALSLLTLANLANAQSNEINSTWQRQGLPDPGHLLPSSCTITSYPAHPEKFYSISCEGNYSVQGGIIGQTVSLLVVSPIQQLTGCSGTFTNTEATLSNCQSISGGKSFSATYIRTS